MVAAQGHHPVLCATVVDLLAAADGPRRFLDATFGGGGHTRAILAAHPGNVVHALDTDPEAAPRAAALSAEQPGRLVFTPGNFEDLADLVKGPFDGILFDFGLSSFHFDTPERGFSFRFEGPLDMRLNPESGLTAREFLETAEREDLIRAVRNYGEEKQWRRVVDAIQRARGTEALASTQGFAALVAEAKGPAAARARRIHPATQTFQGVRIAINRELEVIETALPAAFAALAPGGRLAVISFHSLEDRLAKRYFRRLSGRPEGRFDNRTSDQRPVFARELTRRPIIPDDEECALNPRARSAKLRVLEKLSPDESV